MPTRRQRVCHSAGCEAGYFVTAGVDGVILFWDFDTLDQAV